MGTEDRRLGDLGLRREREQGGEDKQVRGTWQEVGSWGEMERMISNWVSHGSLKLTMCKTEASCP